MTLKIERVKVDTLTLDPNNARRHDRKNIDAIASSLSKFGQTRPLVVAEDGTVLAGNGTLTAALELGWTEIEITRIPFENVDEARAFALADNKTGELAQWNRPVLLEALEELALAGWSLDEIGFEPHDLAQFRKSENAQAPEAFPEFGADIDTDYCCPQCGYEWSGAPE